MTQARVDGSPSLELAQSQAPLPPVHILLLAGVSHISGPRSPWKPHPIHLSAMECGPCLPLQRFSFCGTKMMDDIVGEIIGVDSNT